jgi:non-specific serine/threonine protein kinase/serine/threonine-protein kinase
VRRAVNQDEWNRIKDLFAAALCLPAAERSAFLAAQADAPPILDEVRSFLKTYDDCPEFLEGATPQLPVGPEDTPELAGRRIGSWELTREIGRGGMGIVWEARRADAEYEQRAAVKLLPAGLYSQQYVLRFRDERQILARLDHPGIARLLDGGTLEDGSPFLVMEYVEGAALDDWCDRQQLSLRERLQLFLSVCAAVEYAHRHLVIHRDLKPANILVTPEGEPKLLDFGIAKLIEPDGAAARTTTRLLTPEFASPEQLRGEPVTTSSDVFSLGVLLYLLLTGRKPFTDPDASTLELVRAVCEKDPPPPSAVAAAYRRDLRGELDAVTLEALRKDPEERYPSARALADDVRAWLDGRPVSAVRQPWWRRSVKYVRRHKTQSVAMAVAVVSLLAGSGISLWQASVAHRQRERAERRFRDVRRFSRSLLFELHAAIRNLPGATPARNLLLARATEFLDDLAKDPASDAAMKLELAQGFAALGHVQGGSFSENLGLRDASIESYRKSVRFGEEALAASPASVEAGLILLDTYDDLTRAFLEKNDLPQAEAWYNRSSDLGTAMEARYPGDDRVRAAVAACYSQRALYWVQRNELHRAQELYRKALEIFAELSRKGVDSQDLRTQHAFALKRLGAILIVEKSLPEAESCYRKALAMDDAAIAAAPADTSLRINRTFTLSDLALILSRKKDFEGSASLYEDVLRTRRAALASDPGNARYINLNASTASRLAGIYASLKRYREAIGLGREAIRLRDRKAAMTGGYAERREAAGARVQLALVILDAADNPAFRAAAGESRADAAELLRQASPAVPNPQPNQVLSPDDQELLGHFQQARERPARNSRNF